MISWHSLLPCIVLLVVLQPTSSAISVQKSGGGPTKDDTSVILIGGVSETFDLIRPDKLTVNARTFPNGNEIAELPKRSEYYVGTIYQVRINEIIKGNKMVRSGQTITILIPGPGNVSDGVVLFAHRKYLLQLSSLADAENYKGTVVTDLAHSSAAKRPFESQNVFTIVNHFNNAVPVTEDNKELIERIRREAKKK
jgi:hypothetical protein